MIVRPKTQLSETSCDQNQNIKIQQNYIYLHTRIQIQNQECQEHHKCSSQTQNPKTHIYIFVTAITTKHTTIPSLNTNQKHKKKHQPSSYESKNKNWFNSIRYEQFSGKSKTIAKENEKIRKASKLTRESTPTATEIQALNWNGDSRKLEELRIAKARNILEK